MGKKKKLLIGAVATVVGAAGAVAVIRKFSGRRISPSLTLYRSSRKSKTLHQEGCRYYDVESLAQVFKSLKEAADAGYRPCKVCMS